MNKSIPINPHEIPVRVCPSATAPLCGWLPRQSGHLVLGIESSCDETGVALYHTELGLLANHLHTQIALHAEYGGVVPELASRDHIRRIIPLTRACLHDAAMTLQDIDAIAYTEGPGLAGALLTAAAVANGLGTALGKPVIGIHHLEGHLLSPLLTQPAPAFPFVALLVSGGHTQLMAVHGVGNYVLLGETLDDAAGEAFDKTAKLLDLGYPGGPALSKLAEQGDASRFMLPRPMLHSTDLNFSFAGLKTAVLTLVNKQAAIKPIDAQTKADICAAFQAAIVEVLVTKSVKALQQTNLQRLVVAGGVGANRQLRYALDKQSNTSTKQQWQVFYPPLDLCTDNGAMIAFAGAQRLMQTHTAGAFLVRPRWDLASLEMA